MTIGTNKRLRGFAILIALRQSGLRLTDVSRATGHARWWLSRRIGGRVTPTAGELDQLAAIFGADANFLRYHHKLPKKASVRK